MDNLAHTLIGVTVARAGLSRRFGPGTTLTLALASNLPDLDALYAIWDGWDRFMLRRTHTHALVALPVLAAGLAVALRARCREQSWKALFGLSALGIALHLLFDLVNSFGVVLLWPFSRTRFELASLFIVDLAVWGLALAPIALGRLLPSDTARLRACRASVAALGAYLLLCWGSHERAESLIEGELARQGVRADAVRVFPEPFGPLRFRAAVRTGEEWRVFLCRIASGSCEPVSTLPSDLRAPRVAEVRASPRGRDLDWFMSAPAWTLRPDGAVEVRDLRFDTVLVGRRNPFVVVFPPGSLEPRTGGGL